MRLSILVVSRTAALINRLCDSLDAACSLAPLEVEILCSWNGSEVEEAQIHNRSRYDFHIARRVPYHFAGNMNGLAERAGGEVLMLANDDLILDHGCVDAALSVLKQQTEVSLVGAVLRDQQGRLTHAGINFDSRGSAYHLLDRLIPADRPEVTPTGPVAAVTGALQWIRRDDFQRIQLNENYKVCGEDVELCLDVQQTLGQQVWLSGESCAIHESESTRSTQEGQGGNSEDLTRLRARVRSFLSQATPAQLQRFLQQQQWESHQLREIVIHQLPELLARVHELEPLQAEVDRLRSIEEQIKDLEEELRGRVNDLEEELRARDLVLMDLREERLRLKQRNEAVSR